MVDFKKMMDLKQKTKETNPIDLYNILDRKSIAGPLRPVQEYVLNEWYNNRRDEKDLIVKLHTGEGKTLIALLMLQSILNLGEGPCIYVCPNIYLVKQVCNEAIKFGIPFCTIEHNNNIPEEFLSGEKILITHSYKVFNGLSIFGIGNKSKKVNTIILDDSHACIDTLKGSFTITINRNKNEYIYNKIFTLFKDDLIEQGEGSFLEIESGESETFMLVPYWAWNNRKTEILKIISEGKNLDEIKYVWPLIKDNITEFSCFISGSKIEISPYNINVERFGIFSKANRRILMSATTQEDIFFIKGLNFPVKAVINPIKCPELKWSGEKMILIPYLINEECDRNLVATKFCEITNDKFGVVSLVNNTRRANYYNNLGAKLPKDNDEFFNIINQLRKGNFDKIVVINNRYDGIDLPDESCRVLIIDSKPFFNNYYEKYEENCCPNNEIINKKIAQKIEQGLGRAVRGEKDYCAILIIGTDIERFMKSKSTRKYFSVQTQKQIDIGFEVAKMAKNEIKEDEQPMEQIMLLINQMLQRDEGWKEYYINNMNTIVEKNIDNSIYNRYSAESNIEKLFLQGEYEKAINETQKFIDNFIKDDLEKGWYLQQMARYSYIFSKEKSNNLQKQAFKNNPALLKPNCDIEYSKISFLNENRIKKFKEYIKKYDTYEDFFLYMEEILNNLSFGMSSEKFEKALKEIGEMLGYLSGRPDKEIRKGPDNLWCGPNNKFIVFECKSEVDENRQAITKTEAGQFNNHCGWFKKEYGADSEVINIIIIPTKNLSYNADFNDKVYVMRRCKLKNLKCNIKEFLKEVKNYDLYDLSDEKIQLYFNRYKLNIEDFVNNYVEEVNHLKK